MICIKSTNVLNINMLTNCYFLDAAYYANWLSIFYDLKDRRLKNLLVFSPKIEDLTFLTLICLQTKGKRGKWLSFVPKPPVRKDKAYRWLFRRFRLQNGRQIHRFPGCFLVIWSEMSIALLGVVFCSIFILRLLIFCSQKRKSIGLVRFGFGEAISFSPLC